MSFQLPKLPYAYDALEPFIDKETMTMYAKGVDPQTGKVQTMKSEAKHVTKNERSFTMYTKKGDDWVKSFEMLLKRVK